MLADHFLFPLEGWSLLSFRDGLFLDSPFIQVGDYPEVFLFLMYLVCLRKSSNKDQLISCQLLFVTLGHYNLLQYKPQILHLRRLMGSNKNRREIC